LFGLPSQSAYPALQVNPQLVPLHVGVAFAGVGHTVQVAPHAFTSFALHVLPGHCRVPGSHAIPQLAPSQVAWPFDGGATHGVQDVPHVATLLLFEHAVPQR